MYQVHYLNPISAKGTALWTDAYTKTETLADAQAVMVRSAAMHEELQRLGGGLILGENTITVPKQELRYRGEMLDGHNDHRIVMALSVILSRTGGAIRGAETIRKSYPGFFEDIAKLGAEVKIK